VSGAPSLVIGEPGYPALLAQIYDPPRRVYLRGARVELLDGPCVAVVGLDRAPSTARRLRGRSRASWQTRAS
jgi:predicted Rossmann fold nucleotide-binding protein DprA/Smf involved in DNA uptake